MVAGLLRVQTSANRVNARKIYRFIGIAINSLLLILEALSQQGVGFEYIGEPIQFGLHISWLHPPEENNTGVRMKVFEYQFSEIAFVIGDNDPLFFICVSKYHMVWNVGREINGNDFDVMT